MPSARARKVLARYLWAKRDLPAALAAAIPALNEGNAEPAIAALNDALAFMSVNEHEGAGTNVVYLDAYWLTALGPRDKAKAINIAGLLRKTKSAIQLGGMTPEAIHRLNVGALVNDLKWLDKKVHQPDAEFTHGQFTIVPMPGVSKPKLKGCLESLDKAAEHIKRKFPQLLYGKVYIAKTLPSLASYVGDQDTIQLSLKASASVGDVYALIHEFGHRFDRKFWRNESQREAFNRLSRYPVYEQRTWDAVTRSKLADEMLEISLLVAQGQSPRKSSQLLSDYMDSFGPVRLRELGEYTRAVAKDPSDKNQAALHKAWAMPGHPDIVETTKKIVREPIAVTPYGAKSTSENFAEAFAHLVLGMKLHPEIAAIMEHL